MIQINEPAPEFVANSVQKGLEKEIKLSDFKGKKIALYFYPKDLTPGCTLQAENLRDNFKTLKDKNIVILGVSPDSIKKHMSFIEKKELPFILISDEDKIICNLYGVWGEKSFMGKTYEGVNRTTFIIDENQNVINIIKKPIVKQHSEEVLKAFSKK